MFHLQLLRAALTLLLQHLQLCPPALSNHYVKVSAKSRTSIIPPKVVHKHMTATLSRYCYLMSHKSLVLLWTQSNKMPVERNLKAALCGEGLMVRTPTLPFP